MKSIQDEESALTRTATISHLATRSHLAHTAHTAHFDDLKERAMTAMAWSVGVALVVALYVAMLVALYRWSVYSPIFPPDVGAGAIEEPMPWRD